MGKRVLLAAALALLSSMAFAQHAISLEPEAAPAAAPSPAVPQAAAPLQPTVQVQATLPSELDVYLVPAATREVCTTTAWAYDEVRTDCRTVPIAVRREDPALRGVCITRYGHRICY
jgi:hypothetical protein